MNISDNHKLPKECVYVPRYPGGHWSQKSFQTANSAPAYLYGSASVLTRPEGRCSLYASLNTVLETCSPLA